MRLSMREAHWGSGVGGRLRISFISHSYMVPKPSYFEMDWVTPIMIVHLIVHPSKSIE